MTGDEVSLLRTWRLDLPWRTPPLSLNGQRGNPYARAKTVRSVRLVSMYQAREARIPPLARCSLELHYAPRDRRRRDALNLVATLKPLEDGIVDAGVVPDDDARYVQPTVPVIDAPTGSCGRMYLIVRELAGA